MWNRDLCIQRSIASSKRVGYRRVGTCTRLVVKRSFTNSPARDENNSRQRRRAGIDSSSRSRKCDRPHKAQKAQKKKAIKNEVAQHTSGSDPGVAATRSCY